MELTMRDAVTLTLQTANVAAAELGEYVLRYFRAHPERATVEITGDAVIVAREVLGA